MKYWLILFLLMYGVASADVGYDKVKKEYTDKNGKKYGIEEIQLTPDYILKKPTINSIKLLDEAEQEVVEFSLKENGRRLIHEELKPKKNDYVDDYDRGSVRYTVRCRNYSFHKVEIPDGTIIKEVNFTQRRPNTNAIQGKNLTFIGSNLCNVLIDPTWTIISGLQIQKKSQKVNIEGKDYRRHLVIPKGKSQWEEVELEEIISDYNTFSPFDE